LTPFVAVINGYCEERKEIAILEVFRVAGEIYRVFGNLADATGYDA